MASADQANQSANAEVMATPKTLPKVLTEEEVTEITSYVADIEEPDPVSGLPKLDIPQPWLLAIMTVAMAFMTSITVAGSLFFLLAAPEKVSPHCYDRDSAVLRFLCTFSSACFWTYPVVCCLFVVLVYAKNMLDQRAYYEFLLHKVVINYGPAAKAYQQPTVLLLLVYAVLAFSALIWFHERQETVAVAHIYGSLAYVTPIISFLAVIFTSWSIQGKLITLPNFLTNHNWALNHLNKCEWYHVEDLHMGYSCLERELERADDPCEIDTPRMVKLVEHYTKTVQLTPRDDTPEGDIETANGGKEGEAKTETEAEKRAALEKKYGRKASESEQTLVKTTEEQKEWVYWKVRLLFNFRLQDSRSQSFRYWAMAYMVMVVFVILFSSYLFTACLITCLEIEKVLVPGTVTWGYTHYFSLRPDLGGDASNTKSLKQVAASVAMSAIQTGARSIYNRRPGLTHFQIGAAA